MFRRARLDNLYKKIANNQPDCTVDLGLIVATSARMYPPTARVLLGLCHKEPRETGVPSGLRQWQSFLEHIGRGTVSKSEVWPPRNLCLPVWALLRLDARRIVATRDPPRSLLPREWEARELLDKVTSPVNWMLVAGLWTSRASPSIFRFFNVRP